MDGESIYPKIEKHIEVKNIQEAIAAMDAYDGDGVISISIKHGDKD